MAALSSKERHRSIEEAVYKVFEIPEALQEFSQNVEKDQSQRQGLGVREEDSSRDPSSGSASVKDGQVDADAAGLAGQDGRRAVTASFTLRDPKQSSKKGRFSKTKSSKMAGRVRQDDRNDREDDGRSTSENLDGDDAWENVSEIRVPDLQNSLKRKGGTRKQQLAAGQVRANYARQRKMPARTYSNSTLRAIYKINLGTLKESDYVGLDLPQWCDIEESILSPDKTVDTSPSAGLITQYAHLGHHLHDALSTSDLLGVLSSNTSDKVGELRDLLPEDENFGLGESLLKMLEKADDETLRDIMHVYYPTFHKRSELQVDYDAYYESEPDTMSCCSDPPTAEEEDRMERRAWTIQMSEIFQMLAANVGHLTNYALVDRSCQHFLALSAGLSDRKAEVVRLQRCLSQLMEVSSTDISKTIQNSRQLFVPFDGKLYVLHALDCKMALGRTTEVGTYSGFIGRPVLGLFLLGFYGPNSHMALTLDIVNSLVDYINFSVLDCLPEYEDGLERNLREVLDDELVDNEKKKKKRRSRHDLPVYTSKELF